MFNGTNCRESNTREREKYLSKKKNRYLPTKKNDMSTTEMTL